MAQAVLSDPTQTTTLRSDYEAAFYRRFRTLKGDLRTTVVDNDALRISTVRLAAADDFNAESNPQKQAEFEQWIQQQIEQGVLEQVGTGAVQSGQHYTAKFVRRASQKGIRHANNELRKAGLDIPSNIKATFNRPIHRNLLRSMFLRNYRALKGVTDAMDKAISRVLSDGLAQGWGPYKTARRLNDRVDKIGITRARTVARTETIRTFNEQALTRYESEGVEDVTNRVESLTAQDSKVCEDCKEIAKKTYTTDEAHGILPEHPRCRCSWVPVIN